MSPPIQLNLEGARRPLISQLGKCKILAQPPSPKLGGKEKPTIFFLVLILIILNSAVGKNAES
jgi:hypothetical protein